MKTLTKTIAISSLVAAFAAPAFAAVDEDIRTHAGTNGNINVQINDADDTVTLTGFVEDSYSRSLAESIAEKEGYEVENYLILAD